MSDEITLRPYDVLECDDARYRILGIRQQIITVKMDTSQRYFRMFEMNDQFKTEILSGNYRIAEKEAPYVIPAMSTVCQAAYDLNKSIISEVAEIYGQDCYKELSSRRYKEPLVQIREKYQVSKSKLNRLITAWLQSGCSDYALLDHRAESLRKAKAPYKYTKRPGRKNRNEKDTSTALLDDETRNTFDEIIREKSTKVKGHYAVSFRDVINRKYGTFLKMDDQCSVIREDARKIPTLRQFYYYLSKHSGVTDKDRFIAANSESEYRNSCRPLNSDTNLGVCGVGDKMETDILDADVILRAIGYRTAVGRPHLYLLVDIATRIIPAFYVSYTNNSVTGLQGLLHNIGEDKVALCRKYGIEIKPEDWPSLFIPGALYCDNGADFASNQIMELLAGLEIERDLEPPAMGSMKGTVEHLFLQFYDTNKDLLEEHGLILKRHDSHHYEEATLDMDDFIKLVILFILAHNRQYMPEYPATKEMMDEHVECSPIGLYRFMRERYPVRTITDAQQYQLNCMFDTPASVKRGDIVCRKHHYSQDPDDVTFSHDFCETTKTSRLNAKYTRISADFILYEHDGKWYRAQLNTQRSDEATFTGLTRDQLEQYDDQKLSDDAAGERKNVKILGDCRSEMKKIVKEAEKKASSASAVSADDRNKILQNEKQNVLGKVLPSMNAGKKEAPAVSKPVVTAAQISDMSWDAAMEELYI